MKLTLHQMVRQFHEVGGIPIKHRPEIPSDERVRLRLDMIAEELFELIEAALAVEEDDEDHTDFVHGPRYRSAKVTIKSAIQNLAVKVDLPAFADALTDMDYINEGTRLEFGVYGQEVLEEVHGANMNKFTRCSFCSIGRPLTTLNASESCVECGGKGYLVLRREDGKILKPEGWKPPNIEHVLLEQGWKPPLKSEASSFEVPKEGYPREGAPGGCTHGLRFDIEEAQAKGLDSAYKIREMFPRLYGPCPLGCGYDGIAYASYQHYVYGDW